MPAAMLDKLKAYGDPHGAPVYVPAADKQPEHWVAFVGGAAAQSAWLVTPSDKDSALTQITEWPTALAVDDALVDNKDHGLATLGDASVVWLTVTSRAGMGQPAGLHGVVRLELEGTGHGNDVAHDEETLAAFAGVTRTAELGAKADAVGAAEKATIDLMSDDAAQKLAAQLGDPKTSDADLAALIPPDGVGTATVWQKVFVQPAKRVSTPADLRALVAGHTWSCQYTSCEGGGALALLGTAAGKVIVHDVLLEAAPAPTAGAHVHEVVPPSATTTASDAALRARGTLGAKVLAEAPYGAHGTIGVARADGGGGMLVVRDGDWLETDSAQLDDDAGADKLRFVDVDGDGAAEVAIASVEPAGMDESDLPGGPVYVFDKIGGEGRDLAAGLAAIGATDLDDAVARALAVPMRPVTADQACKLIHGARHSLKKAGPHARVMAFIEPSSPEIGHSDYGKGAAEALQEVAGQGCELVCDAKRPECERPGMGPDTEYVLFDWSGDKLQLALAMVYRGA